MSTVTTNDLKKGTEVRLSNGWTARLEDNKKGNIRLATVDGIYKEMGSIYAHDIVAAQQGGQWVRVEHTPAQKKLRNTVNRW